jgi:ribosome-dependent ATPase
MEVRKNLGYMTQAFSLYGEMTIRQNLVLHARLYHLRPTRRRRASTSWCSASASGAPRRAGRGPADGLRQRLSLAVAVLHEPQILILDEPTSGVDPWRATASGSC